MRVFQFKTVLIATVLCLTPFSAFSGTLEPQLTVPKGGPKAPQVALTLDLCMGDTDNRIFDTLIEDKIKATLFVTARWLRRNKDTIEKIKAHPELFEVANHGANHIPAIDNQPEIYGLKTAGSLKAVCEEVENGEKAMTLEGFPYSNWYRDASARYSPDAIKLIKNMGYQIGGFSLNADMGASLSAKSVESRIGKAKDGDVIIAHMNQPKRQSGAGVSQGIKALKNKGFTFIKLSDGVNTQGTVKNSINCLDLVGKNNTQ